MKAHHITRRLVWALSLAVVAAFAAGCSSCKPGSPPGPALSYDLQITPGESLKGSSVVVDVVGINQSEIQKWQTYSLRKYWKPADPLRQDATKFTVSFLPGDQSPSLLTKTNQIWGKWLKSGVQYLVVVADLPGVYDEGKIGSQDPRRQMIPICKCYWPDKTQKLDFKVQAGGVTVNTMPREGWLLPPW